MAQEVFNILHKDVLGPTRYGLEGLYYFAKRNETKRNEIGSDEIKQKE